MSIHPKLKPFLYGLVFFFIFMSISVFLKLVSHRVYSDAEYFGVISNKDLMLGLLIAFVVSFTHQQKKRLK